MSNLLRALAATAALAGTYAATSVWAHPLPLTVAALVTSGVCVLVFHFAFQLTRTDDATPAPAAVVIDDVFGTDDAFGRFLIDPRSPRYARGVRVCCPTVADGRECLHSDTYAVLPLDVV